MKPVVIAVASLEPRLTAVIRKTIISSVWAYDRHLPINWFKPAKPIRLNYADSRITQLTEQLCQENRWHGKKQTVNKLKNQIGDFLYLAQRAIYFKEPVTVMTLSALTLLPDILVSSCQASEVTNDDPTLLEFRLESLAAAYQEINHGRPPSILIPAARDFTGNLIAPLLDFERYGWAEDCWPISLHSDLPLSFSERALSNAISTALYHSA